jgi:restriction endonuclease S subunit
MQVNPGYLPASVDAVPANWQQKTLIELASGRKELFDDGDWIESEHITTVGIRLIQTGNIGVGAYVEKEAKKYIYEASFTSLRCKPLEQGDLLICRLADPAGRACVLPDIGEPRVVTSVDVTIFRPPPEVADRVFLCNVFSTPNWFRAVSDRSGGTTHKRISRGALGRIAIALPPIEEQRAIAAALNDMDALLTGLDRLIAKKRDLKQAAMQQLLTGQTRLPGFQGEWETKQLFELADVDPDNLGVGTSPSYSFKYISLENVDYGVLRGFSQEVFETAPSRARRILRRGDVLVSTVRPNLKSHLLFDRSENDWVCSTGFAVVRAKSGQSHPGFLFAHLFAYGVSKQIEALLTGSNYPAMNSADVRCLEIPAPAYAEQTAIATVLSDMDAELAALEARRDKTRALKQGMMQELLTGRTRLT